MIPGGVCPVVAVPFRQDGAVDMASFDRLVAHLSGAGASLLSLFGLASEFHKLDDAERSRLAQRLVAGTGESPAGVMLSVTDHATEVAVERAVAYADMGADALTVLPPFFLQPTSEAIVAHVEAVLAAVDLPVVVQYAPGVAGQTIEPAVWVDLHREYPHLCCIKVEGRPAGHYVSALGGASQGSLGALVGEAGLQLPDGLRRGARGVQPGCSFVEIYVAMWRSWEQGDAAGLEQLHTRLLPYISDWMQSVERIVQVEKTILHRRGIIATDRCRRPGHALDAQDTVRIDQFLDEFAPLLEQGAGDA